MSTRNRCILYSETINIPFQKKSFRHSGGIGKPDRVWVNILENILWLGFALILLLFLLATKEVP
ncbi:MAG: hypothetical protein CR982_05240 [Candidatus Cloacimonadota bacterium]|nr:MAG: hypothetical protein CR982_05240 [Candidatus Cloacimonadota bacterium]